MEKPITLTVKGRELHFTVTLPTYNRYINELTPTNKVGPAENFLRRTIMADDKDALADLMTLPGASVQLAATLLNDFMPDLEIEVGK